MHKVRVYAAYTILGAKPPAQFQLCIGSGPSVQSHFFSGNGSGIFMPTLSSPASPGPVRRTCASAEGPRPRSAAPRVGGGGRAPTQRTDNFPHTHLHPHTAIPHLRVGCLRAARRRRGNAPRRTAHPSPPPLPPPPHTHTHRNTALGRRMLADSSTEKPAAGFINLLFINLLVLLTWTLRLRNQQQVSRPHIVSRRRGGAALAGRAHAARRGAAGGGYRGGC